MSLVDVLSWLFLSVGALFVVLGGVGLHRFDQFYNRVHGAGLADTLGTGSILVGLALQAGLTQITLKLVLVGLFLLLTGPAATHALVKAAYARGLRLELPIPDRVQAYRAPESGEREEGGP